GSFRRGTWKTVQAAAAHRHEAFMKTWIIAALLFAASAGAAAQERTRAFIGARIPPITGPATDHGTLVIDGRRNLAVGPAARVRVPDGAERIDVRGKTIMPGLVDTHSHIAGPAGGDSSAPLQAETRVLDAIDVRASSVRRAQAGGITTANVMPGSGHLLSGQTLYLKLRGGGTVDDFLIRLSDGRIAGGVKMANGTNSIRTGGGAFPGTRARSAALARAYFLKAQDYREKLRKAGDDPDKRPPRDLAMEALVDVLEGRRVVHFHTHRHDDILTVIRLAQEFNFRPVLQHVSEGWRVADAIAKSGLPASIIMIDSPGGKLEAVHLSFRTGAALEQAGVLVGLHTDDPITDSR